ncbi:ubiquinol-cytochrome c reductase iron-sulfur subunit [Tumebacillus flagellatus]|uniref:Rieske (2Fe-2S) protein n=1 Tax=Tumebacillus flagellatus TaxID=1157490 RepID=A0A074MEM7_9BACL|nr:ubiquinol-cytochrome c reductase iron-sulfur subunit [Tumebacillus flagellatus]KEO84247.1 Rieske (2Fe-2S) protein [Tumebacillus flagellatus]
MSDKNGKQGLSRRQFLSYALGGTGAFMAATIAAPLVPFAIDPLTRTSGGGFADSGLKESDVKSDFPTMVDFKVHRKDGWIEENVKMRAWLIKDESGKIMAMSPICTHLGCQVAGTVDGNGNPKPSEDGEWWFHCPCHGGRYTIYGINDKAKPPQRPLDLYEVKVEGGKIMLGAISQRKA